MKLVELAALWALYYSVHSLLATTGAKALAVRRWAQAPRFYRLAYNQLSVWGFLATWRWQEHLPAPAVSRPGWLAWLGAAAAAAGLATAVQALRGYDLGEFAGWKYVRRAVLPTAPLHTAGLNAHVRHPLYLGVLVLLAGAWLLAPTWPRAVFGVATWAYVLVGLRLEERKLVAVFGPAYRAYQRRVPALWPAWPGRRQKNVPNETSSAANA